MPLTLEYHHETNIPVEVPGVVPDRLTEMPVSSIERMECFVGNTRVHLADLFRVSGDPTDAEIRWTGNLSGVHWMGAGMQSGRMLVDGDAGRHLGSELAGGEIDVRGSVGDWAGAEMKGGHLRVRGDAGHLAGAAYRGSRRGMTGGTLIIDGRVGNEIGLSMRRGLIAVGGDAGDIVGFNMLAGTILVFGQAGIRHGAGMKRGTIGLLGQTAASVLPTFRFACRTRLVALTLLLQQLVRDGLAFPRELLTSDVSCYNGDFLEGGRGEILFACQ